MGALRDPQLEKFAQALLANIAHGMPRSKAAEAAARASGYTGKSLAPNARKRAQRKDVKARMVELAQPAQEQAERELTLTLETATQKLAEIVHTPTPDEIKPADQIAALGLAAKMFGWLAPKKSELSGTVGIERIERVIVEHPSHRDGPRIPAAAGAGAV